MYKEIGEKLEQIFKEIGIGRVKFEELTGVNYILIRHIINSLKKEKPVQIETMKKNLYPVINELSKYGPGYKVFAERLKEAIKEYELLKGAENEKTHTTSSST
ncbi:hypothetical protein [Persephonella sp.]